MRRNDPRRHVAVLVYDRLCTFEFGIAVEVFGLPRPEITAPWYTFRVCSLERGDLRATGGVTIRADAGLEGLRGAGTIVIPGWRDPDEPPPARLATALRAAHARGARLVTICSGVFILAATGLADGRRVTTHWKYVDRLQERFPGLKVEPDVLYVEDGGILTSAGSAAGIDACLHLVRSDHGAEIAHQVARRLIMPPQRDGGQAQYIPTAARAATPQCGLTPTLEWMQRRLADPLRVEDLARRAAMSPRTFARRFRDATGTTPHQWLIHQRILAAQRLLETTPDSIDGVAEAVGLQTAATLRQHFLRALSTTPTAYRRRFSRVAG
jgi:AraC family transcriptional activator FtrA